MIQFPIDFKFQDFPLHFRLNDEWTLSCDCDVYTYTYTITVSLMTNHHVTSKGISILGRLSLSKIGIREVPRKAFSVLMKEISSINLVHLQIFRDSTKETLSDLIGYHLFGYITITFNNETCANVLKNEECGKSIQPKSLVQLSNNLEQLLDPQTSCFADVNLICGDVAIPAHKNILSARSPVFAAMFKNPMKENRGNRVDITDVDATVLRTMTNYIYTGKTSNLTVSSASDLLFAADKYQLQDLKEVCCDFLKRNVCLQNLLGILVAGDLHSQDLKSFTVDYISKGVKFSEIEKTEEWKALRKERPALAMDVLTSLVKARDIK